MKKGSFLLSVLITAIAVMAFSIGGVKNSYSVMNASGPPAGYSGDPASNNRDCSSCHTGPTAQIQQGWISSNIPAEGFMPDSTYTITAIAKGPGHSKFGFQISPQDSAGNFLGTLVNTGSATKLTSDPNYITQTAAGTSGSDSLSWTFDWIAPANSTGFVNFYGSFNLANGDGRYSGDTIVLSVLSVYQFIPDTTGNSDTTNISAFSNNGPGISVYPNPARDFVTIEGGSSILGSSFYVIDQSGRRVLSGKIDNETYTIDIHQLQKGLYYIQLGTKEQRSFKVLKN